MRRKTQPTKTTFLNMNKHDQHFQVEGIFYVNQQLERLMLDELKHHCNAKGYGGFLPGVKQIANVAALPGIVGVSSLYLLLCIVQDRMQQYP